ncbi:MAG: LPS biosynthesis protein PseA [Candidatus Endolissoclinum sp. TMED37]|nr:MAG: LPS biosynthesis protein PseA [Candidatus Endolissoclinum sp. TMED37]
MILKSNTKNDKLEAKYGLPNDVKFCKSCVISNQRPSSTIEFYNVIEEKKKTINLDKNGICDACKFAYKKKNEVDWEKREEELKTLLNKFRSRNSSYDVLVPGSGGKDSIYASHLLKYKYNMKPLTVTWSPHLYTDIGFKNFQNWLHIGGFDNFLFTPNGKVHRKLTKLAYENLLHPFQPFILGQKYFAPKIADRFNIPLVFYGENEAEYGNPIDENLTSKRKIEYFVQNSLDNREFFLSGLPVSELEKEGINKNDLDPYLPVTDPDFIKKNIEVHYLGYYKKWTPQECYYYSVENAGFQANPERTEGTYSKYNSLDDKTDGFHYWTTYIKFGIGRATYDASQEIRNGHINREEGVALVRKYDGEFPIKYFKEFLKYIDLNEDQFFETANKFRSPHLWKNVNESWQLRYKVT